MAEERQTILCTVVYKGVEAYIDEFLESVKSQDVNEFDFLIINDGMEDLSQYTENHNISHFTVNSQYRSSLAKTREQAIQFAIENGYKYFIFADSDDVCHSSRISSMVNYLKDYDMVFSDMTLIDSKSVCIGKSYYNPRLEKSKISFEDLLDKNCIGLSNFGARVESLKHCLPVPDGIIAVDWWIAANISLHTDKTAFISQPLLGYRQYLGNLAGANTQISIEDMKKAVLVKKLHYRGLSEKYSSSSELSKLFYTKYAEMTELEKYIEIESNGKLAISLINGFKRQYLWWEYAYSLKKLEEIKNEVHKIG